MDGMYRGRYLQARPGQERPIQSLAENLNRYLNNADPKSAKYTVSIESRSQLTQHSVLLRPHSLDILASDDGVVINRALLHANMALGVSIELLGLGREVEVDGVAPREEEEDERNAHGVPGADLVGDVSEDDGDDGAAANGGDEEGGSALGVATESTKSCLALVYVMGMSAGGGEPTESEDDWEDAGFEEECDHQHGETTPVGSVSAAGVDADGSGDEYHDERHKGHEHDARLAANVHDTCSGETTSSKETLSDSVEVGALDVRIGDRQVGASLREVVDEVSSDTDLSTNVGELGKGAPEEGVLLTKWLVDVSSSRGGHLSLVGHVGIGDLRDGSKVEDNSEDGDEAGNSEVDPLNGLERFTVFSYVLEDDLRCENGSDD
jgi:hypothetical protein